MLGAHLIGTKQRPGDVPLLLLDEGQIFPVLGKHGHVVTDEMSRDGAVQHGETRHQPGADCGPAALLAGFHDGCDDGGEHFVIFAGLGAAEHLRHASGVKDGIAVVGEDGILQR